MATLEKTIENRIKSHIRATGGWVIKIHADEVQGRDSLDLLGSYKGKPFFIDVKRPYGFTSPLQDFLIRRARDTGYVSGTAVNLQEFEQLFVDTEENEANNVSSAD